MTLWELPLSTEAVAAYRRDGFLAVASVVDADELDSLTAVYDRLFAARDDLPDRDRLDLDTALPQIVNPERYAPELVAGAAYVRSRAIADALLGPGVVTGGNHAICKPPHTGSPTPWHQDEAYWDPAREHHGLSIWIPLQDVDAHNGCMEFIPGSHRAEVAPHELVGADTHALRAVGPVDATPAVACPIPAGAATVHDARTMHYTGPNRGDGPRRALVFAFGLPSTPRAVPASMPWQRPEWYSDPDHHDNGR